ncbi:hypothetical protein [Pseudomonas sp. TH31]|uniref:hypothetical protein n=1 Tax=Pseudomonas sp. TH31 TaxID=2796396 RepID=UPI00191313F7|nr:hypothetical protein [Pseudomonas sp. TH31]MBK5418467.1 hypothetical protein [Pseudomonas sp. TH31]
MTVGLVGNWTAKAGVLVRQGSVNAKPLTQSVKARQILSQVGTNPLLLDKAKMDSLQMYKQVKGFDPENVSVKQLGNMSTFLKQNGIISDVTALTLLNAGSQFDKFGVPTDTDAKFNALEYFAVQLDTIQSNNLKGNKYANYLVPEYKKAIYALQNLKTYGETNGPVVKKK